MSRIFAVELEAPEGDRYNWTGPADSADEAQDQARAALDPEDTFVVIDVEEVS